MPTQVAAHKGWQQVIGTYPSTPASATTTVEFEVVDGRNLLVLHEVIQAATGGYVALYLRPYSAAQTLTHGEDSAITTLTRTTNVVTAVTAAHNIAVGNYVTISGSTPAGATTFDGTFLVATVADSTHFTYAQTADNDSATGGTAYNIVTMAHGGSGNNGGWNIPSAAQSASYACCYFDTRGYCLLKLNVTNGSHQVWVRAIE